MVLTVVGGACGAGAGGTPVAGADKPVEVRLGYFPNLTHGTALVGLEEGLFAAALGPDRLRPESINAGPAAVEALFAGAIDAAYMGPTPTINAFVKSRGEAVRVIAGATSGGAALVVRPELTTPRSLKGKELATPQLGGTQDVALRYWLRQQGLSSDREGGGDVSVLPQENAQTLETFRAGGIDGAWLPEPWATRLVVEAGAAVLVDEATLWPQGRFVTTQLVVRAQFLRKHPATVRRLLEGHVRTNAFIAEHPDRARQAANEGIERVTGRKLPDAVIARAWENLSFMDDPIPASLRAAADHAHDVGLQDEADLRGIYDLGLLNEVRAAAGLPAVGPSGPLSGVAGPSGPLSGVAGL
ncbi:MAG: ABC transporter substrate-binding protein [Actinobacteria bacterium]|nr:ABC transporter substrate-binding protein [Actinomycetota bacterium]